MPITPNPEAYNPSDGDYRMFGNVRLGEAPTVDFISFEVLFRPGSSGYTEAQMDEVIQQMTDLFAAHGGPAVTIDYSVKLTHQAYAVTPTEEP